ncbi:MAG: alginate lyase family protein [Victivallaceae bacterium]
MKPIISLFLLFSFWGAFAGDGADFAAKYPERWKQLTSSLKLPELSAALVQNNPAAAGKLILDTLRESPANRHYHLGTAIKNGINLDDLEQRTFNVQGKKATLPRRNDGYTDWNFIPQQPQKLDMQFPSLISRFGALGFLLEQYVKTGNGRFRDAAQSWLIDFTLANPYTMPRKSAPSPENDFGHLKARSKAARENYAWLTLNAALRLQSYIGSFFVALQRNIFDDETMLLWLSSIEEHADYLYSCGFSDGNWGTSEMLALLSAAGAFPQFSAAERWKTDAVKRYCGNLAKSVYPDGAQAELAHMYGYGVLRDTMTFCDKAEIAGAELPPDFRDSLVRQIGFYALITKPDGNMFAHGDSDSVSSQYLPQRLEIARKLGNDEARWLLSGGTAGTMPAGLPSRFCEWSGLLISQSDWTSARQWISFDVGPFGIGHYHPDKLGITLFAGRELLTDPGRYAYNWVGGWTPNYFGATAGHNTISIDGCDQYMPKWDDEQKPEHELRSEKPIRDALNVITPEFDRFHGRVNTGYRKPGFGAKLDGKAIHDRTMHYQRGRYILVFDRIFSDRPRKIEAFWHFGPDCEKVSIENNAAVSRDPGKTNLLILPIGEGLDGKILRGSEKPQQGWYAPRMNEKQPISTAVYSTSLKGDGAFGWLLLPFAGERAPEASVKLIAHRSNAAEFELTIDGKVEKITIPLALPE